VTQTRGRAEIRPSHVHPGSSPDRQDLAAELAEHYLIEQELGRGGSATVYLAQDLRHGWRTPTPSGDSTWAPLRAHPRFARLAGPA
jgi:hypothetical protein